MANVFEENDINNEISYLSQKWIEAKQLEEKWKTVRVDIENKLISLKKIDANSPGSHLLDHGLKVSCKLNRKWKNEFLKENMDTLSMLGEACPFKLEFKEDKKKMDALELYNKEIHLKLQDGVDIYPAKPSFSIKGDK